MKFVSFYYQGNECFGIIKSGEIIDLSGRLSNGGNIRDLKSFLEAGSTVTSTLGKILNDFSHTIPINDVIFRIPIVNPSKIFCVGRNYYAYHEVV
mgnify:FL=1